MFRFLLILALSLYILSKIGGFFFRIGASTQQRRRNDDVPPASGKQKKKPGFKGGDYVDYEEVK